MTRSTGASGWLAEHAAGAAPEEALAWFDAREGWQPKAITSVEVKGRLGPGGVEGVLVTFERPLA